jgi:SAM-dependent methyltransferase
VTPLELETDEVVAFAVSALPPPPAAVLEVGCGDGRLAARLSERGWKVTAIDLDAEAVTAARARGVLAERADFVSFAGGRFDALLFTRSFHHVSPLADAVARARALLAPGGALLLDEFAHDEIDRFTAAWFFDVAAALEAAAGAPPMHGPHRGHGKPPRDPLERWRWRHHHEPPLHGARAMLDALGAVFELSRIQRLPYLYRYFSERLPEDEAGGQLYDRLHALETERVAQGVLVPVGLRVVGHS